MLTVELVRIPVMFLSIDWAHVFQQNYLAPLDLTLFYYFYLISVCCIVLYLHRTTQNSIQRHKATLKGWVGTRQVKWSRKFCIVQLSIFTMTISDSDCTTTREEVNRKSVPKVDKWTRQTINCGVTFSPPTGRGGGNGYTVVALIICEFRDWLSVCPFLRKFFGSCLRACVRNKLIFSWLGKQIVPKGGRSILQIVWWVLISTYYPSKAPFIMGARDMSHRNETCSYEIFSEGFQLSAFLSVLCGPYLPGCK